MKSICRQKLTRLRAKGVTLVELAVAMMILSILSVAVSNLVMSGVQSQMNQRIDENLQIIGMNIVEDIRLDLRHAAVVDVAGGAAGNTLNITTQNGGLITYRLNGNNFERIEGGFTKIYNDPAVYGTPALQVGCFTVGTNAAASCFVEQNMNSDPTPRPREIRIANELRVQPLVSPNTVMDNRFGPARFSIRDFSFDVMSSTEFQ